MFQILILICCIWSFAQGVRQASCFILLCLEIQASPTRFVEETIFSLGSNFHLFVKDQLVVGMWFNSLPHWSLFPWSTYFTVLVLSWFHYCCPVICIEIKYCDVSSFIFTVWDCFIYSGSLLFQHEFWGHFFSRANTNVFSVSVEIALNL